MKKFSVLIAFIYSFIFYLGKVKLNPVYSVSPNNILVNRGALKGNIGVVPTINYTPTISTLESGSFAAGTTVIVQDSLRGGVFNHVTSAIPDSGTVFPRNGGGYWQRQFNGGVSTRWFGAKGDGIVNNYVNLNPTDDAAAIQLAVNYCLRTNTGLLVDGTSFLGSTININRSISTERYLGYFIISSTSAGGFICSGSTTMFGTSLPYTNSAVSEYIMFKNLTFTDSVTITGHVASPALFRIQFINCSFNKINLVTTSTIKHLQSWYLDHCSIKNFYGNFFYTSFAATDIRITGCDVEDVGGLGTFLTVGSANTVVISNNTIEGIYGTAIKYNGSVGLQIKDNYFEGNQICVDGSASTMTAAVNLSGNEFASNWYYLNSGTTDSFNVKWGSGIVTCTSLGNFSHDNLHQLRANSDIFIKDYVNNPSTTMVSSNPPEAVFEGKILVNGTTLINNFTTTYAAKSLSYSITSSDHTIEVKAKGQIITLPTAVGISGREYTIKLTASGSATIATTSSQTIDGSLTYSLSAQYKYVTVQSNGSNWLIIANN